jgi:HlyD family secretion protein
LNVEQTITKIKTIPRRRKSGIIIFCILVLIAAGALYFLKSSKSNKSSTKLTLRTATAGNQDLSTTITGSGSLISANLVNISSKTNGTITKLNFKQGDIVKAGQVIATLDPADALNNVQNAKSNLQQAEYQQTLNLADLKNLTVRSVISGQITSINANVGDIVQKNGDLFTIIDTKDMKVTLPFNGSIINGIKVGSSALINLSSSMESINGKVTYINNSPYSTTDGGELYNVEISFNNPGSLSEGMTASADIKEGKSMVSSANTGTLAYINKITVRSNTGGTVQKINAKLYDKVNKGDLLLSLDDTDVTTAVQTNAIKIASLKQQVDNSVKQLGYCTIVAPISGTITAISNREGDTLKLGDVLTSITDINHMQFDIPVDELDIAKVKVGQDVDISVDALSTTSTLPLTGKVKQVAVEGTSSNGVTTYNVTVAVTGVTDPRTLFSSFMRAGNGNNSGQGTRGMGNYNQGASGNSTRGNRTNGTQGSGNSARTTGGANQGNGTRNNGFSGMRGQNGSSNRGFAQFDTSTLLSSLKDGMNANATVYLTKNKGVLSVPLEAVSRISGKSYVMVNSDAATIDALKKSGKYIDIFSTTTNKSNAGGTQNSGNNNSAMSTGRNSLIANKDYYKNAIPTVVEVGVNTDTDIQITSGLKAGAVVILPPVVAGTSSSGANRSGFGMFGGGGGGGGNYGGGQQNRAGGNNARTSAGGNSRTNAGSGGGN